MEYTSRAVGNAALTTGIIGTSLGALSGAGSLAGLYGSILRDIAREEAVHHKHIKMILEDMHASMEG